jgi:hypothetical protein
LGHVGSASDGDIFHIDDGVVHDFANRDGQTPSVMVFSVTPNFSSRMMVSKEREWP